MPLLNNTLKLQSQTGANYPDLSVRDPQLKTAEYIAQYGQAHISDYQNSQKGWWGNSLLTDRLAYAQGRQDAEKYRRMRTENSKLDNKAGRLDLRILKVVPKYIKTVSGLLDQSEYIATANPIDALADDQKQQYAGALRAQMEMGNRLSKLGLQFGNPGEQPPLDEDDLQLKVLQYKNKEALRLETELTEGLYDCNYVQLSRELDNDNLIFGRSCTYLYTALGKAVPQRVEPWRLFLLPSRYEDCRDLKAGAYLDEITIGQMREEAGTDLEEKDYLAMASTIRNRRGQSWQTFLGTSGVTQAINSTSLEVIRFGFMSLNMTPDGTNYWTWYEGTLIPETGYYYGCRPGFNQLYDMENPGAVLSPFIATIPDLIAGESVSVVDEVMAPADFVQRQWIKMQDELNRSVPKGYAYDLDRIEDVVLSEGKKLSKKEVIEMFERTGRWVHNGVTIDGTKDGNIGLRELPNGISPDVSSLYDLVIKGVDLIERMTGVNSAVSAGNVEKRMAVGGLEIAKEGAINALKFLFVAQQSAFERCCRAMAVHFRQTEMLTKGLDAGWGKHRFRMTVEQLPTKEEKQLFMQTVNEAVAAGMIDVIDALFVKQIKNPRMGIIVLAARAKRKQAEKAAADQANIENTAKAQQASNAQTMALQAQAAEQKLNYDLALQKAKDDAATNRAVLLESIKKQAQVQIEYYHAITSLSNTALSGSWKAALQALPSPTDAAGGATAKATQAATLTALLPHLTPPTPAMPLPVGIAPDEAMGEPMAGEEISPEMVNAGAEEIPA